MASGESGRNLEGLRLAFVGPLASMSRREAAAIIRKHGAVAVDRPSPQVDLVVVGEADLISPAEQPDDWLDPATREAVERGRVEVIRETQLWERLGLVESEPHVRRLYTPAMLAELLHVPVAVIRRWHRRGLIQPVREVRRLPYFDFQEVAAARRLAEMLAAGTSPAAIEKKLAALARFVPGVARPLAQLSIIVEGRQILLRQGDGLIEPGGQLRFDFAAAETTSPAATDGGPPRDAQPSSDAAGIATSPPLTAGEATAVAAELEEAGRLEEAVEMYRAAMAAAGPTPECCFQLAELLYRLGDLHGARERYYMAIELDDDYVEARANLGCVLAELGQRDLAAAAFEGALAYHPEYADAHYHLAKILDEMNRHAEAEMHWSAFVDLAPNSPWANQARQRLIDRGGS